MENTENRKLLDEYDLRKLGKETYDKMDDEMKDLVTKVMFSTIDVVNSYSEDKPIFFYEDVGWRIFKQEMIGHLVNGEVWHVDDKKWVLSDHFKMKKPENKLESLPRLLIYKGHPYFLNMHVNFRNQLCIQYQYNNENYILSYVVQPELEPYEPESIESSNGRFNENIGNCRTLDDCIEKIQKWIDKLGIEADYYKKKDGDKG